MNRGGFEGTGMGVEGFDGTGMGRDRFGGMGMCQDGTGMTMGMGHCRKGKRGVVRRGEAARVERVGERGSGVGGGRLVSGNALLSSFH